MKTLSLLSVLALGALVSLAPAAPVIKADDVSEATLKDIATERQKQSMKLHEDAVKKAQKKRDSDAKEVKEITVRNDNGLKKTIQRRHLNTMLPPCERTPETPREPGDYVVRPEW